MGSRARMIILYGSPTEAISHRKTLNGHDMRNEIMKSFFSYRNVRLMIIHLMRSCNVLLHVFFKHKLNYPRLPMFHFQPSILSSCDFLTKRYSWSYIFAFLQVIQLSYANWGSPSSSQYHIQTDEGPERFFRYQTDNGQFRKEKRLQDGTVIGTNAWIDGFGYLRQNDYIADHAGYRVLKAKTVFVGKDRPIQVRN